VALNRALGSLVPDASVKFGIDGADGQGGARIALKWPNDVLADGAKLAGILLEAQKRPDGRLAIVIGFGVNVVAAPEGLPYPAASIASLGWDVAPEAILGALTDEWVDAVELWKNGRGIADILAIWRSVAAGIGAPVAVSRDGEVVRGVFETIDDAGRLIVRANDNSRVAITAGDVHFGATASVRA
jgi:BirA family transcriptional regulator, biotin operon repressor / biotin---[acetyl-CoA-carboxylase] ligase